MALNDFAHANDVAPRGLLLQPQHVKPKLTPASNKQPVQIVVPEMNIEAIPNAMRRMGWQFAAVLMERWFAHAGWTMPNDWKGNDSGAGPSTLIDEAHVDDQIITMAWALGFRRCEKARLALLDRLDNPASINMLRSNLKKAGWDGISSFELGSDGLSARAIDDNCQQNAIPFGQATDSLDDMYGALGRATLKLGVVGEATLDYVTGRPAFYARKAAFYIRDYYDFNGDQFLGVWTENGILNKSQLVANSFSDSVVYRWHGEAIGLVHNEDFRNFRKIHQLGGDFMIFSDVFWMDINRKIDLGGG